MVVELADLQVSRPGNRTFGLTINQKRFDWESSAKEQNSSY